MYSLRILTISLAMFVALPAHSAEQPTRESVLKLMEVMGASRTGTAMIKQVLDTLIPSSPGDMNQKQKQAAEFKKRYQEQVNINEVLELTVPVYQKHLTQETVDAAIEYYGSPPGKALVAAFPAIQTESFEIGNTWGASLARDIIEKMKELK